MTWINRIIMIPFLISLLISIIDYGYLFYSLYIAFAVGCFQVFASLITAIYFLKFDRNKRKLLLIYLGILIVYFLSFYLFIEFENRFSHVDFLLIIFWILPILFSFFWTYILESIKKES
jgi:hypothetical protein